MNDFTISIHKNSFEFLNIENFINLIGQKEYILPIELFANVTRLTLVSEIGLKTYDEFLDIQLEADSHVPENMQDTAFLVTITVFVSDGEVSFTLYFSLDYHYIGYDLHESPFGMKMDSFDFEFRIMGEYIIKQPMNRQIVID